MKVICSILLGVFLTISVPCASGFVPCTFQQERLLFSLSARDEQNVKEEPNEKCYSVGRRSMLATCSTLMAPIVLLPAGASSSTVETEVEPDFDCLLDLPSVAKDHVRLYLCRHGQTENNRLRKVQGARVDPPVNDNGALQALNLGKALARADPCPQVFFSSNLERARMTAGIAAKQVDPNIQPRQLPPLAEVDFGPIAEGKPIALAKAGMEATYAAWAMGNIDYRPSDGGDSGRDVLVRAAESLNDLTREAKASNGCVAAVTHSAFLRILLAMVLDESLVEAASRQVVNGGITVIDVPKDTRTRPLKSKPRLLGGPISQVPRDFKLDIPVCKVVRINEKRHLPKI